MNIAALLGTSGMLPDQLGKVVSAGTGSSEFKQLLQNMTTGEVAQEAAVPLPNLEAEAAVSPGLDLLSTLFKLFDKGFSQPSTLDPTGEASDADQDENKASLTELMAALQPLVGQSEVTLAAGEVALQTLQSAQSTTTTSSTPLSAQSLTATDVAGFVNLVAGVYGNTNSNITSQLQPVLPSNPDAAPPTLAEAMAKQAAATSTVTTTTTPNPTLPTTESTSTFSPAPQTGTPISTAKTAAQAATQPATAAGATNELNRPDLSSPATSVPHSSVQSVNGAPARGSTIDFAQAVNSGATTQATMSNGANRPVPAVVAPAMPAPTTASEMVNGQAAAANNGQQPTFTGLSRQSQPDPQTVFASGAPSMPTADVTASVTQTGPAAAPEMPKLPLLQQVTDSVKLMVQQGETEVRMQLHPKSLGELHIQLHMTQEGAMTVRMLTETVHAQNLLHENLPQLKAAFSAQGMQVTQMNVDVGSDSSAFYNQARNSGQNPFAGAQHMSNNRGYADDSPTTPTAAQNQVRFGSFNAIDFHA